MSTLIVKLNATGDVVRTTTLLRALRGPVTWITARNNRALLEGTWPNMQCLAWEDRAHASGLKFDLAINLEDELETASFVRSVAPGEVFGAYLGPGDDILYTPSAREWFDMSLVSRFGRQRADELKLLNRRSYQQMIFSGLGLEFNNEAYVLPEPVRTKLTGDVAIAPVAGAVWPMKNWAHYQPLQDRLRAAGLRVNMLPKRESLLEHLGDIANHRCLVGGDSLPMHLALGLGVQCVTLFNCTSPWEIHDYGLQTKLISPRLAEFFYKRTFDAEATAAIGLDEVLQAVLHRLSLAVRSP
jgi:heptosyltransferase II